MSKGTLNLLDVTLREGAYLNHFSVKDEDAKNLVDYLTSVPLQWLEVASAVPENNPFRDYHLNTLRISFSVKNKSKIGCLWTPECETETIHPDFLDYCDFVRIGTNITEISKLQKGIEQLKNKNLKVFVQLIRSSTAPAKKIAEQAQLAEKMGADAVYIVDTFGSYTSESLKEIIRSCKEKTTIPLGYHSHNNSGLSLITSWTAYQEGCEWIDGSLLGAGRIPGNLQLESFILFLEKQGIPQNMDLGLLYQICESMVSKSFSPTLGIPAPYLWAGYFNIDLQPLPSFQALAARLGLSLYELFSEMNQSGHSMVNSECLKYLSEKHSVPESTLQDAFSLSNFS